MKDFGYILIIMIEIAFTIYAVSFFLNTEKKLVDCEKNMLNTLEGFLKNIKTLNHKLQDINKTIKFVKNLRLSKIKQILTTMADLFNLFLLLKVFKFKKRETLGVLRRIASIANNIKQTV